MTDNKDMGWEETRERARRAIASAEAIYPHEFIENARELMMVNEWRIAIETLCDNLSEASRPLPKELFNELSSVATAMGIGKEYLDILKVE